MTTVAELAAMSITAHEAEKYANKKNSTLVCGLQTEFSG